MGRSASKIIALSKLRVGREKCGRDGDFGGLSKKENGLGY
jgi:hypothetical protein